MRLYTIVDFNDIVIALGLIHTENFNIITIDIQYIDYSFFGFIEGGESSL